MRGIPLLRWQLRNLWSNPMVFTQMTSGTSGQEPSKISPLQYAVKFF
jgi:hypothetical protein